MLGASQILAGFDKYMVIPFKSQGRDSSGLDCWGQLTAIYQDMLGIQLESFGDVPAKHFRDIERLIEQHKKTWVPVRRGEERMFDAVIMSTAGLEQRFDSHVGCMTSRTRMIHTEVNTGPRNELLSSPSVRHRIVDIRRHVNLVGHM